jgi:hypothetical protein
MQPRNPAARKRSQNTRDACRWFVFGRSYSKSVRRPGALVEEITTADGAAPGPTSAPPTCASPSPRRPGAGALLNLVNGVLAGIGGVYVGTHSVLITVIAGVMALVVAAMTVIFRR